jgi:hypothetical protein
VRQGIRLAQRLCYAKDWGNFRPVDREPDPFGRKNKHVTAAQVYQQATAATPEQLIAWSELVSQAATTLADELSLLHQSIDVDTINSPFQATSTSY